MTTPAIHEDFDAWAAAALTDGLSPEDQIAFSSHLAACAPCRVLYQKTQAMNESLTHTFAQERPAPGFEHKLVAAFRQGERKSWLGQIRATMAWVVRLRAVQTAGVLAALALLVAVGNQLSRRNQTAGGLSRIDYGTPSVASGNWRGSIRYGAPIDEIKSEKSLEKKKTLALASSDSKSLAETGPAGPDKAPILGDLPVMGRLFGGSFQDAQKPLTIGGTVQSGQNFLDADQSKDQGAVNGTFAFRGGSAGRSGGNDEVAQDKRRHEFNLEADGNPKVVTAPSTGQPPVSNSFAKNTTVADSSGRTPQAPSAPAETQSSAATALPALPDARKLIRNASVELEVGSFDMALDKLATAATQSGGYVATKNSARGANGKLRGTIVVKVLPQNLDGFLLDLRTFGEVKNQTLATQDVTKEYTDTAARLRNSQRMEERLLKMLDEAKGKMSEVLQVEKELGRVRESIETMQGELKLYDSLVSYATITLSLYEKDLNQPAAFLLRQTGNLELLAADVEKTYADARRLAESVQAQISDANLSRDPNGKVNATMQLLIPATASENTIRQLKTLGRIQNFTSQTERIAQNGNSSDAGANNAKVDNAPAVFRVTIQHDEATHRQIRFTVFAKDLDQAFDAARKAASEAGAEVVNSNLVRPRNGAGNATLVVRVPAAKHAELVATLQKLGRASDYQVQRDASPESDDAGAAPVLVSLQLTDEEPSVQQTRLRVEANDIGSRVQDFKEAAMTAGATVRDSAFQRLPDGRETAQILLRFPLTKYADLLAKAQALGTTQELTVERRDIAAGQSADSAAPAELSVTLGSRSKIVADNTGLFATLRHTLSQAIHSLLWSVQMIGVALAFLAPWVIGAGAAWFLVARLRQAKRKRAALEGTDTR